MIARERAGRVGRRASPPFRLAICLELKRRRAASRRNLFLMLASGLVLSCSNAPLRSAVLPEVSAVHRIAVLPFVNETGSSLRRPPPKFMRNVAGPLDDPYAGAPPEEVAVLLQERAAVELVRRGYAVIPPEQVRSVLPRPPEDALEAARAAKRAGFEGAVLSGTIHRFHLTETGLLQVWLDLVLVDPGSSRVLWSASARRPVKVAAAQTWQEVLLDAGEPIFTEAFGSSR
jgi:hypothetical protein